MPGAHGDQSRSADLRASDFECPVAPQSNILCFRVKGAGDGQSIDEYVRSEVADLIGSQSKRSADAFDLVLISNAYTLELINLPYLLIRSGIPLFASERGADWPPLILGGSNTMAAQCIIRQDGDSLVDAIRTLI